MSWKSYSQQNKLSRLAFPKGDDIVEDPVLSGAAGVVVE
jgi:hypothetical protein